MFRAVIATSLLIATAAHAAEPQTKFPVVIPAPSGAVVLASPLEKGAYDKWRYAAVRRVDNTLYLSGVIVHRQKNEGNDAAAFKLQVRRAFNEIKASLAAAGASFNDVAMVNSFHVWNSPNFVGSRDEHFDAFYEVAGEFIKAPYPAWTAVGTTGLLADGGLVEVQMIARVPE
jgi:enamine deaminase RidA (YjgF/YER057c/UK114 family)